MNGWHDAGLYHAIPGCTNTGRTREGEEEEREEERGRGREEGGGLERNPNHNSQCMQDRGRG